MKKYLLILFTVIALTPAFSQTKTLLNLDKEGVAIQGYDPVAYFTEKKPVKGKPEVYATYKGALYYFATKENKNTFLKEPAKYEPEFGGYCAYGVSKGKLVEIDPAAFQIVNDRLLLQYSLKIRDDFNKDTDGNLTKAKSNWPGLLEKKGK